MQKQWYVYVLASKKLWVLYVWVTSNLLRRIYQHKNDVYEWFTKKYFIKKLVYYEIHPTIESAIVREKQIKAWNRNKKIELIESINKEWDDLYDRLLE